MTELSAPRATLHPTIQAICWAAGIYEGEGTCSAQGLAVAQSDRWILDMLQRNFGGRVTMSTGRGYVWSIYGPRARGFLMTIYKFLSPWRRQQAMKLLS